ncbi:NPC intracellular cholesterol transporter 2 homolog a-like [Belonocnema kinseyi]|uniref:NPC intracellular cholesterol transporter 2 homolog a-like n=1 Tax=Belonocnema kinseyi TaxID=2817044 RepID=UPI00143DFA7F|nr:NPC intracellular cholesterol transporter 2 homolog a-like [Belonocnema kinseyi]
MLQELFVITLLALAMGEENPQYEICESTMGSVLAFSVSGTEVKDGKCILKKNTTITANVTFKTNQEVKDATVAGKGMYGNIPFSFPLNKPKICEVLKCPLEKNVPYNVEESHKFSLSFFTGDITVYIKIIDTYSNATIACVDFQAEIVRE